MVQQVLWIRLINYKIAVNIIDFKIKNIKFKRYGKREKV